MENNIIKTKIGNEVIEVDLSEVWRKTFAYWATLVDTETAKTIATVTERVLRGRRGV